jgi:hypothetical protein
MKTLILEAADARVGSRSFYESTEKGSELKGLVHNVMSRIIKAASEGYYRIKIDSTGTLCQPGGGLEDFLVAHGYKVDLSADGGSIVITWR